MSMRILMKKLTVYRVFPFSMQHKINTHLYLVPLNMNMPSKCHYGIFHYSFGQKNKTLQHHGPFSHQLNGLKHYYLEISEQYYKIEHRSLYLHRLTII